MQEITVQVQPATPLQSFDVVIEQVALMNGLSAYELALENGFIGTLEEWLASLKGADGAQGIQGIQGEKGLDGSPDTAEQIVDKLETLTGDDRLDASAIKNIPNPDLSSYYTKTESNDLLNGKVDKVTGKGLSTNDLTNALKTNYDAAYSALGDIQTALTAILGV